jgi:hypothetical protein
VKSKHKIVEQGDVPSVQKTKSLGILVIKAGLATFFFI